MMRQWAEALGMLAKSLLIYLPCILFLALPAMAIGYLWCWVVGGFHAGELLFVQDGDNKRAWNVRPPAPEGE